MGRLGRAQQTSALNAVLCECRASVSGRGPTHGIRDFRRSDFRPTRSAMRSESGRSPTRTARRYFAAKQ